MSSSSATATASRSPSPVTPESSSDGPEQPMIQDEISSWYNELHVPSSQANWDEFLTKPEDGMLQFDDFIDQTAYDDSPSTFMYPSPAPSVPHEHSYPVHPGPLTHLPSSVAAPAQQITSPAKPVAQSKKRDPASSGHGVLRPDRDSCYNLPIVIPSIPEGGTKSRVETQVRVTVDLVAVPGPVNESNYDRVGSWKWLRLPPGTATKKRTRKQGKVDPLPADTMHLSATVSCATAPYSNVLSCSSCQSREAKRVARKLAQRVRPAAKSDSDSDDSGGPSNSSAKHEDTTSIIQFNCPEFLDFSTGSVILPLRITCYCRHHREKTGFHVHFTMSDSLGRVVGTGTSRPIMITDDHKSVPASVKNAAAAAAASVSITSNGALSPAAPVVEESTRAPSKRKGSTTKEVGGLAPAKKRSKPYDNAKKTSREASLVLDQAPPSPRSQTPPSFAIDPFLQQQPLASSSSHHLQHQQYNTGPEIGPSALSLLSAVDLPQHLPTPQPSPHITVPLPTHPMPMPFMFYDQTGATNPMTLPSPRIHRMIPNTGPTHGGIEVTILGANFHSSVKLSCVFGDVVASSTQRWSENTLVCVLPPRALPGAVAVWFEGFEKEEDATQPSVFTYTDESDRALMELALQVVGLKMTGKIEDAKNVAIRIVGNAAENNHGSRNGMDMSGMMQLAAGSSTARDIRPLLLLRAGENEDYESLIVDFLSILDTPLDEPSPRKVADAISHPATNGQTLLHLAAFLAFPTLAQFLIARGADLDARDRNGFTPLHFAALSASHHCARMLVNAGADTEIVNARGKTAEETCVKDGFFDEILRTCEGRGSASSTTEDDGSDEEAAWGDAEEDAVPVRKVQRKRSRRLGSSCESSLASVVKIPSEPSEKKKAVEAGIDEKERGLFVDLIQRTIAQLYAPHGLMPQLQLPLPHLPQLLGMPAWGAALPQIPPMFPVFVPMPAWASSLGGAKRQQRQDVADATEAGVNANANAPTTEWRNSLDKFAAAVVASMIKQDEAPPVYTPREKVAVVEETKADIVAPVAGTSGRRGVTQGDIPPLVEAEVGAFEFRSKAKQEEKLQRKHDRMLILFWIPILLIALVYASYTGVQFMFYATRTARSLKGGLRGALRGM